MNELERAVARTLRRYLSGILADSLRDRATTALGVHEGLLTLDALPRLVRAMEPGIRLFAEPNVQDTLLGELHALERTTIAPAGKPAAERHAIRAEADVAEAATGARELAIALGGNALAGQRAGTAAAELARNVLAHGGGEGVIELLPGKGVLLVRATDRGPGIAELDEVLSGRRGGRGLLAVRRIASRFDVRSTAKGTRVDVEITL